LAVPVTAVRENGQLQSVFVVTGGLAHTRLVTLGERHDGQIEVLSGLENGDRIIAPVPAGLTDGDSVQERP
jgi:multidrug efflux pump subunit AcrA (membrane-fusion protein)